jgi:hypothetical protein
MKVPGDRVQWWALVSVKTARELVKFSFFLLLWHVKNINKFLGEISGSHDGEYEDDLRRADW